MIIQRMRASFGKLNDRELVLRPGLNVISGDNEAGKSTWLAFLLAMLYGVDTKDRVKAGRLPDKVKFQPWNGKPMAGTLELLANGRSVTIERRSESSPMGDFRAWDSDTGTPREDLTGRTCGQTLLGVEAAVFARSAYLRQQRISVSADALLERRLSGLVTAGNEDYAYAEVDEKLKKQQITLRHNRSGALPRAEQARADAAARLAEIERSRRQLEALQAELTELKAQREECREVLGGLDALDRQERMNRVSAAEAALAEAREDREGWESVCAELPDESLLQELEAELQQLQAELQRVALEEGLSISELELPEPDPIFERMGPKEAHDKAAADATLVQEARDAKRPRRKTALPWYLMILAGLGIGFAGSFTKLLPLVIAGVALALAGLGLWIWQRVDFNRRKDAYLELQKRSRAILLQYGAKNPRGVVIRGIAYINGLEERERELAQDSGEAAKRRELEALADRRSELLERLEQLMPGSGSDEKAALLFQEARQSRQSLAQARLLEQQRQEQLDELRFAVGEPQEPLPDASRFADRDRETEQKRLEELERQIEETASKADKLSGAVGQMGDPAEIEAQRDALDQMIQRMEERYAALRLARRALMEADENLRARFAPVLCQKTGELFSRLTGGKYDKIQLDRNLHVMVHPADSAVFRPLSYLSGGTVDQLYLALRLAICELLIPDAPIILDDALVYFDDKRIALALETLRELSKTRQVLIFTCQSREKRILDRLAAARRAAELAEAEQPAADPAEAEQPDSDSAAAERGEAEEIAAEEAAQPTEQS